MAPRPMPRTPVLKPMCFLGIIAGVMIGLIVAVIAGACVFNLFVGDPDEP